MNESRGTIMDLFFRNVQLLVLTILVVVLAGISALTNLPRIEDPRITTRNAIVLTAFPGASAERVEALVTKKLEEALREVEEIKTIRSTSRANISVISIALDDAIDSSTNEQAFARVRDKLADAEAELPAEAQRPVFDDERGAFAFGVVVALSAPGGDGSELGLLSRLAAELADKLRNMPGAERVRIYGDADEEITVTLDRGALAAQGLTAATVAARVAAADPKGAAGALRSGSRDLFVEVGGELDSVSRIRNLILRQGEQGQLLRLGDVARVGRHWRTPPDSYAFVDGQRTVLVGAAASADARIDQWQERADRIVSDFAARIDKGVHVDTIFRQSEYTSERLTSLGLNLLLGAGVVMLVVLFGLGWRAALIVGSALPLSAFATLFGLTFFGQQIHQMTIFGMIIAIGLLIDNAIVVTDDIQVRRQAGESGREAVAAAVGHLFSPLLASTITTILGFMPIFLLPGNVGDFVGPIAISVVLALIASFLISLTIVAALAGRFIPPGNDSVGQRRWWRHGIEMPRTARASRRWLQHAIERPWLSIAASLVLPILGFALVGTLSVEFFPPAERDQFEIEVWLPDDASLERTRDVAAAVERTSNEFDGIERVSWLIGGSHPQIYYNRIMDQDGNAAYAHAMVTADSAKRVDAIVAPLQSALDERFPSAQIVVAPFAQGPPVDAPVGFRIVGPDIEVLEQRGAEFRRIMHQVPGITRTRASLGSRAQLTFAADQRETERVGLTLDGLALQLQGNLEGLTGGAVREDLEELPVRIRYDDAVRGSLASIASMPLLSGNGREWLPATALGDMRLEPERARITRYDGERANVIQGWVRPGVLPIEAAEQVLARLDVEGFSLPPGYELQTEGDSDAQQDAVRSLLTYLPILIMLMIATLVLSFRSVGAATVILVVAGLSAGLGMLSLWLSGYNLGFNPMIGSAGLIGVAINGAIIVLNALRVDDGAQRGITEAIVRVTMREARHVLATTMTTMGGFLPLLLFTGGEFWPPLAVVIAGGVGFSVILSLVFTPAVFRLMQAPRVPLPQPAQASFASVLLALLLAGCAVGPDYAPPPPDHNETWLEAGELAVAPPADWWRRFDDPLIEQYVEAALAANHELGIATARLREARALGIEARSVLMPTVNFESRYTDYQLSEESPTLAASAGRAQRSGELHDSGFDAVWELDVFGGNRRRLDASGARIEAGAASVEMVRLSVAAEVVRSIVELRGAQRRLEVAVANEALQHESLELVEGRVQSGIAPELDALNAQAQLEGTRSTVPLFEAAIRTSAYRLATLTARAPAGVLEQLEAARPVPESPAPLAIGLRGDVLRNRPDVRAAERRLAAATADTGVAIADRFPRFVLNAQFGWQAIGLAGLGESDTETSAVLGIVRFPLFTGGRLGARVDAARARQDAAERAYRQAVLLAIEESEGALIRYRRVQESCDRLVASAEASAAAADIARKLYDSGLRDFLSVLDADRRRLEAEDALAARRTEAAVNLIAVYKALGVA